MTTDQKPPLGPPYVGPRSLRIGEPFYGREKQVVALQNRFMSERVMLLYSPSGAGKTSLIDAGLVPELRKYGYRCHQSIRVNDDPEDRGVNRFRYSMVRSLERDKNGLRLSRDEAGSIGVTDYLNLRIDAEDHRMAEEVRRKAEEEGRAADEVRRVAPPHVLIFDQFEELLTYDRFDQKPKLQFLEELGTALRSNRWWALFSMREEYLGAFDQYRDFLPNRLTTAFRLDLLKAEEARQAIEAPALERGRPFNHRATDRLLETLMARERGQEAATSPYVEPVHLQVVCLRIWQQVTAPKRRSKTPPDGDPDGTNRAHKSITVQDIKRAGGVDRALKDYYRKEVGRAAKKSDQVSEKKIRDWFNDTLLTPEGIRRLARTGPGELINDASLAHLTSAQLVREEPRSEITWYELSHDRLVAPVMDDNTAWYRKNLNLVQSGARRWSKQDENPSVLLDELELREVERQNPDREALEPNELKFLEESERARKSQKKRQRLAFAGSLGGGLLIVVLALLLLWATTAAGNANQSAAEAEAQRLAGEARATDDPNLALLLALEAVDAGVGDATVFDAQGALYQANGASRVRRALLTPGGTFLTGVAVANGPDGSLTILGIDGVVYRISEPRADDEPLTLFQARSDTTAIAVSSGGSVASISGAQLQLIDEGDLVETTMESAALDLAFIGDERIAVVGTDGILRIYDSVGLVEQTSIVIADGATRVKPLFANRMVVGTGAGHVIEVDAVDGTIRPIGSLGSVDESEAPGAVTALATGPRGLLIAVAREDLSISVFSRNTPDEVTELDPVSSPATALAFIGERAPGRAMQSLDLQMLAIATADDVVHIDNVESGTPLFLISPSTGTVSSVASIPGNLLAVASSSAVTIWDLEAGHGSAGITALASIESGRVLSAGTDGRVIEWNAGNGVADVGNATLLVRDGALADMAVSDSGAIAVASGATVEVRDPSGSPQELHHDGPVRFVRFGADSKSIVSAGDREIYLWDVDGESPEVLVVDPADDQPVRLAPEPRVGIEIEQLSEPTIVGIAIIGDDVFILLPDGRVAAWNTTSRSPRIVSGALDIEVTATVIAATAEPRLIVGDDGGDIQVLDPQTSQRRPIFGASLSGVVAITAGPAGRIAAAFGDRTVEVWAWEPERQEYLLELRIASRDRVRAITFSGDDAGALSLVIATDEGRLLVHPLDLEALETIALAKISRKIQANECERFELDSCDAG